MRAPIADTAGVRIHLSFDLAIIWDGRYIEHRTAMAIEGLGEGNELWGFFTVRGGEEQGEAAAAQGCVAE